MVGMWLSLNSMRFSQSISRFICCRIYKPSPKRTRLRMLVSTRFVGKDGHSRKPCLASSFPSGFNQTFSHFESIDLDLYGNDLFMQDPNSPVLPSPTSPGASPTAALLPSSPTEPIRSISDNNDGKPRFYPMVIVIEADDPGKANAQLTFVSFSSGMIPKIIKQCMIIDRHTYFVQEIFGFSENVGETTSINASLRDCIICMSEMKDTIVLPCRHLCICGSCAEVLRMQAQDSVLTTRNGPPKCPICRQGTFC